MVTTDKDLFQCICEQIGWYSPIQNKAWYYRSFMTEYGIEPRQFALVKAIAGCSSDNVPGIKGVGDKTALKYVKNELPKTHKTYRDIENNLELINFNKEIVCLPHQAVRPFGIQILPVNYDLFDTWCRDNDIFFGVSDQFETTPF
jgi:5'-3' exonuclease